MNQFPTLVEYLLLSHDYVVIPGLGTFIVQQQNAKRNAAEEAFLPPIRSVRFNTELTHADNLVLDSIQTIYGKSAIEAEQMLCTWVNEFRQTLEDCGYIEFGAIGMFTQDDNAEFIFQPHEAGVTTPEYYGLDAFHISEIAPVKQARMIPMTASMEDDGDAIVIRINRNIANTIVAACVAILLFVFFNNPIPEVQTEQRSSVKELLIPSSKPSTTANTIVAEPKPASTPAASQAPASESSKEEVQKEEFCVVMASHISRANAERFVQQLTDDGFASARILDNGKTIRVAVGYYTNKVDANADAHDIRQRSSEYSGAWVMEL